MKVPPHTVCGQQIQVVDMKIAFGVGLADLRRIDTVQPIGASVLKNHSFKGISITRNNTPYCIRSTSRYNILWLSRDNLNLTNTARTGQTGGGT
jgi:hypothetical protein